MVEPNKTTVSDNTENGAHNMVRLIIDNCEVVVPEHTTILDAAKSAGIQIPTLCYLRDLNEIGGCRVCVDACPSSALYGTLWHTGLDRDDLFDHLLCERTAKERTGRSFGIPIAICGKCFAVCPV